MVTTWGVWQPGPLHFGADKWNRVNVVCHLSSPWERLYHNAGERYSADGSTILCMDPTAEKANSTGQTKRIGSVIHPLSSLELGSQSEAETGLTT